MNTLGSRLKSLRGGRSQAEFARFLGIPSQPTYQRYEDEKTLPNAEMVANIALRCGVSCDWLLGLRDSDAKPKLQSIFSHSEKPRRFAISTSDPIERLAVDVSEMKGRIRDLETKIDTLVGLLGGRLSAKAPVASPVDPKGQGHPPA